MREYIVFYRNFYEAIRGLKGDIQCEIYTAIMEYGLYGKSPEDLGPIASAMFQLIKPNIDAAVSRQEARQSAGAAGAEARWKNGKAMANDGKAMANDGKAMANDGKAMANDGIKVKGKEKEKTSQKRNPGDDDGDVSSSVSQEPSGPEAQALPSSLPVDAQLARMDDFAARLSGNAGDIWREGQTRRNGVRNFPLAFEAFKAHAVANGKLAGIQTLGDYQRYFNVAARFFLTPECKAPAEAVKWRAALIHGSDGRTFVRQDGRDIEVPADTPKPPSPLHAWNGYSWEHV